MSFRDIKNSSRQALHDFMSVPASFYATSASDPVPRSVRPHSRAGMVGDLAGTNLSYVETHDRQETVVLLCSEFSADLSEIGRGGLIVLSESEGYWIESRRPRDGLTVTVEVIAAEPHELVGKTLPGDL